MSSLSLHEYLKKNNIILANELFRGIRNINDEEVINQIKLINDVDIVLTNYCTEGNLRATSNLGRCVEEIKVEIKKLRRDLIKREKKQEKNDMDKFLLDNGEKILNCAEEKIKLLNCIDYIGLIKRSMKKKELCIGKGDERNLRKLDFVEIGTLKKINYNLREEDIYEYLLKVRRCVDIFNYNYYINEFVSLGDLDNVSGDYLKILLSIPRDTMRQWYRYSSGKRGILSTDYLVNIEKCLGYES